MSNRLLDDRGNAINDDANNIPLAVTTNPLPLDFSNPDVLFSWYVLLGNGDVSLCLPTAQLQYSWRSYLIAGKEGENSEAGQRMH